MYLFRPLDTAVLTAIESSLFDVVLYAVERQCYSINVTASMPIYSLRACCTCSCTMTSFASAGSVA